MEAQDWQTLVGPGAKMNVSSLNSISIVVIAPFIEHVWMSDIVLSNLHT